MQLLTKRQKESNSIDPLYVQIRYVKTGITNNTLPIAYTIGTFGKGVPCTAARPIGAVAFCVQLYQKIDYNTVVLENIKYYSNKYFIIKFSPSNIFLYIKNSL